MGLMTWEDWPMVYLSLQIALLSVVGMLPVGIGLGWLLAKKDFVGKDFLNAALHLPLVIPPVVTGFLLLSILGRRGVLGGYLYEWFGIDTAFTWKAAVMAAMVMGLPLMVRSIRLSIEGVDGKLEEAAKSLGASGWRVFWTVTLPLSMPGVMAGTVLAFARALGEFGATITFAGNIEGQTRTLPLAIYTATQTPGADDRAFRLVGLSVLLAMMAVVASEYLSRRMIGGRGSGEERRGRVSIT